MEVRRVEGGRLSQVRFEALRLVSSAVSRGRLEGGEGIGQVKQRNLKGVRALRHRIGGRIGVGG